MIDEQLLISLLAFVKTTEDKRAFLSQLDMLNKTFFSHGKDILLQFDAYLPYGKKEKLFSLAHEQGIDVSNTQALQSFVGQVITCLQNAKEVRITISFEPSASMINKISTWFVVNIKKAVILDIIIDPTLIGGVIIGYNGFYKDLSLKKILQDKYQQKQLNFTSFFHE